MIPREVVQVELIDTWWESLLPISAIVISLISVGLTLWFRYSDRLRIETNSHWVMPLTENLDMPLGYDRLAIKVTNRSRTAVTEVSSLKLGLPDNRSFAAMEQTVFDHELPAKLEPGQSVEVTFDAYGLGVTLRDSDPRPKWVQPTAECGHRVFKGKKDRNIIENLINYSQKHPRKPWESA